MKPTDIVIAPEPGQLFAGIPPGVALDQADGFGIIGLSLEIIEQFFITYGIQGIQMTQRPQPPAFILHPFLQHQDYQPVDPSIHLFSIASHPDTDNTESPVFGGVFP